MMLKMDAQKGAGDGGSDVVIKKSGASSQNYTTFLTLDTTSVDSVVINLDCDAFTPAYSTDNWSSAYGTVTPNQDFTVNVTGKNTLYLGVYNNKSTTSASLTLNKIQMT